MDNGGKQLTLVKPDERLPLKLGGSVLFYRRLSLGALAAIERQHALPSHDNETPSLLPPHVLEAAIVAHALVGWEGVLDPLSGEEARFGPETARRLPAAARRMVAARAQSLTAPEREGAK